MPQGIIDLGYWGLKQQHYGADDGALVQNSTNDPLICSSGSCGAMTYAQLAQRFPRYTTFLTQPAIGMTQAEVRDRTYASMVYGEAAYSSFQNRETIYIPPGIWYFNTEMRSGQNRNIGAGCQGNAGSNAGGGGTFLRLTDTNWKSIHGAQNDGLKVLMHCWTYAGEQSLTPQFVAISGGNEYMHHMTLEHCTVQGTSLADEFWTPGDTEVLFMLENAGERSGVKDCHFWNAKGFAVLVSKNTARPAILNSSFFYNQIAAIGVRGGARGKCVIADISCDNNPYVLFMYQSGSNVFGTGAFMPQAGAGIPGGNWSFNDVKVEAFACRWDGGAGGIYNGMQSCPVGLDQFGNPNAFVGRGGMFARVSGRGNLSAKDCTLFSHGGVIWTAVEHVDQSDMAASFPGQGWGSLASDNFHVSMRGTTMYGVQNWLADYKRQRVHPWGVTNADSNRLDFNWNNFPDNGTAWANSPTGPVIWPTAAATHKGIQPFINSAQAYAWTGGTPNFNYHPVTGVNF